MKTRLLFLLLLVLLVALVSGCAPVTKPTSKVTAGDVSQMYYVYLHTSQGVLVNRYVVPYAYVYDKGKVRMCSAPGQTTDNLGSISPGSYCVEVSHTGPIEKYEAEWRAASHEAPVPAEKPR